MFLKEIYSIYNMGIFNWLFGKKMPVDRVDGGEIELPEENIISAENPNPEKGEKSKEELEHEKKERMKRFIARMSALMERVELLERKMDRVESRLGIRDEKT